jgi:hypothetical protein
MVLGMMLLLHISCAPATQTAVPPISEDKAILIAATNVPYSVIRDSAIVTLLDGNNWVVYFILPEKPVVTKNELEWPEGPDTKFENQGILPADTFGLLMFSVDGNTGDILSRDASDSFLLGGPGVFYTEPQPADSLPLWCTIAAAITGVLIGGISMWLIMRRKKRQVCSKSNN